jgi:predicted RNase H-like HicB family nuclease
MNVTANVERDGKWWAIRVPEIDGLFSQAKRLDKVEFMVKDAARLLGVEVEAVTVVPALQDEDAALVETAKVRRADLRRAEAEASAASRNAVARLRALGLPVRDVATLMGVSPQRVSVLAR